MHDGARAGIFVAQGRDEDRRFAVVVELEVDGALGEDGTLELGEGRVLLHGEAVLEDEAGLDVGPVCQDEELGGTGVDVGRVQAASVQEADCGGDAGANERGEGVRLGENDFAASAGLDTRIGAKVEIEDEMRRVAFQDRVLVNLCGGELDHVDESLGDVGIGCRCGGDAAIGA